MSLYYYNIVSCFLKVAETLTARGARLLKSPRRHRVAFIGLEFAWPRHGDDQSRRS